MVPVLLIFVLSFSLLPFTSIPTSCCASFLSVLLNFLRRSRRFQWNDFVDQYHWMISNHHVRIFKYRWCLKKIFQHALSHRIIYGHMHIEWMQSGKMIFFLLHSFFFHSSFVSVKFFFRICLYLYYGLEPHVYRRMCMLKLWHGIVQMIW